MRYPKRAIIFKTEAEAGKAGEDFNPQWFKDPKTEFVAGGYVLTATSSLGCGEPRTVVACRSADGLKYLAPVE